MNAWNQDPVRRWAVAILVAAALVIGVANLAKWIIEGNSDIAYTIHYATTVPIITLIVAYFLQKGTIVAEDSPALLIADDSE